MLMNGAQLEVEAPYLVDTFTGEEVEIQKFKLSILIPMFNEEKTLIRLLKKVVAVRLPPEVGKEIILINDGSTDSTHQQMLAYQEAYPDHPIIYLQHKRNVGKGMSIRIGIKQITGQFVIIQDADLEYDPADYLQLLHELMAAKSKVIYGSRFMNKQNKHSYKWFYWGGLMLTFITNSLYGQTLTDESTCFKMFDADLLKSIQLECTGFEFCTEITAKVSRLGHKIVEVPITYFPRSFDDGKKIKWHDGLEAIWILIRFRFWRRNKVKHDI